MCALPTICPPGFRRPCHALPPRPLTSNRIIVLDAFQLRPDLPKVLDITCLHTDFGQGRLVPSVAVLGTTTLVRRLAEVTS